MPCGVTSLLLILNYIGFQCQLMYTFFQHSESVFYFLVSNYTTTFVYNKNNELANWLVQLNRQL